MKRLSWLAGVGTAVVSMLAFAAPAGASTTGTVHSSPRTFITCSRSPGHYCAKFTYKGVSGGVKILETQTTGYTKGKGEGREWFRYSCNAGTCYILPSATFHYSSADVQLNVTRKFGGGGKFLPCGNVLGVQYHNPAVNAPGGGAAILKKVVCSGTRQGTVRG